jgi:N-acetylglucosamine-6-phosphate deacetylase
VASETTAIVNGRVVTAAGSLDPGCLVFRGDRIAEVGWMDEVEVPRDAARIEAKGSFVLPGFIEIHIHGGNGHWPLRGEAEDYVGLSEHLAGHGVTSFLATLSTAPEGEYLAAIEAAIEARDRVQGARFEGLHIEGPYLSPEMAGAQRAAHIRAPDLEEAHALIAAADGLIRVMTLAPERKGAHDLIRLLIDNDVKPALGHSAATYEEAMEAFDLGATHVTHIFNTMPQLHHRDPGIDGAALVDDRATVEIIADGLHLHPGTVALVVRAKQVDQCVAVTDALPVTGLGEGGHRFAGETISVRSGAARLPDGKLAGSILTMERALENLVEFADVTLEDASLMASRNPARATGMDGETGELVAGGKADIVILSDALTVQRTIVAGRTVHES